MPILKCCADSFENLFHKEYIIKAGRKNTLLEFSVVFMPEHFFHLSGLHKLEDIPWVAGQNINKAAMFHDIQSGKFTYSDLQDSVFISEMEKRLPYFDSLEDILQVSKLVFRFDKRKAYCSINADIMMYKNVETETNYLHLFLRKINDSIHVPCSFFLSEGNKYVVKQERYTVLDVQVKVIP